MNVFIEKHKMKVVLVLALLLLIYFLVAHSNKNHEIETENEANMEGSDVVFQEPANVENENESSKEENHKVFVDVKGEVVSPGVYEMEPNIRVAKVIELAGGFTKEADKQQINLAQKVEDEMVVFVPKVGEELPENFQNSTATVSKNDKININHASIEELEQLPQIGPSKAAAILEYRQTNGQFQSIEDIKKISGIGNKTFEKLKEHIAVQ